MEESMAPPLLVVVFVGVVAHAVVIVAVVSEKEV